MPGSTALGSIGNLRKKRSALNPGKVAATKGKQNTAGASKPGAKLGVNGKPRQQLKRMYLKEGHAPTEPGAAGAAEVAAQFPETHAPLAGGIQAAPGPPLASLQPGPAAMPVALLDFTPPAAQPAALARQGCQSQHTMTESTIGGPAAPAASFPSTSSQVSVEILRLGIESKKLDIELERIKLERARVEGGGQVASATACPKKVRAVSREC